MAKHIKSLINGFIENKKKEYKKLEKVQQIIDKVLNEDSKKHIKLKKIFKEHLVFHSDASSYTYSFNLRKQEILKEINKKLPKIKKISIKTC